MEAHHVQICEPSGTPTELVPATRFSGSQWILDGTPGIVNGCASGDRIDVSTDGTFEVLERGGNLAAHVYSREALAETELHALRAQFSSTPGALVEWPDTRRFVVATVPVEAGFRATEQILDDFVGSRADVEWYFGNVYDEQGQPLNWW